MGFNKQGGEANYKLTWVEINKCFLPETSHSRLEPSAIPKILYTVVKGFRGRFR
jgi:hypothetical protein